MGQLDDLTPRQREVAELMARGYSNKQIAKKLGISIRTVESHRAIIYQKLFISSVSELYEIINPVPVLMIISVSNAQNTSLMVGEDVIKLCQEQQG